MAMELLDGIDLREAIDRQLLGTLDEKLNVLDSVLAALDYAHAKGVVHRDVKPANIHLGRDRQAVKLMDFGLARVNTSEMTQEGIVLGTPNYMSPEQALGDKVDGRSDIFSAGAVLYEILTGHKPFEADTTPSVLFQVVHKQPPPVRRWVPDMPAAIVAVVNRSLEKDLKQRFPSAGDMRAALSIARNGTGPSPKPSQSGALAARGSSPAAARGLDSQGARIGPHGAARSLDGARRLERSARGPAEGAASQAGIERAGARRARARAHVAGGDRRPPHAAPAALAAPAGSPAGTTTTSDTLAQELVRKQLQLAQRELENKNYAAALSEAQGVLKLSPGNAEARAIISSAQGRQAELERSVAEARRLLDASDNAGASRELQKVLELDPQYPPAAELAARLNGVFKAQAEEAAAALPRDALGGAQRGSADRAAAGRRRDRPQGPGAGGARRVRAGDGELHRGARRARARTQGSTASAGRRNVHGSAERRADGPAGDDDRADAAAGPHLHGRTHQDNGAGRTRGLRRRPGERPRAAVRGQPGVRGAAARGAAGRAVRGAHPAAQRRQASR